MNEIELKKLVGEAKKNDNSARETLYLEFYKEVLYVCRKYNLEIQDAEDITQNTFITAFEKISDLKDDTKFGAWILRIASNKCMDLLKHNKVLVMESVDDNENIGEIPDNNKTVEDVVIDGEVQEILANMIQSLPQEQRLTVFMYYYQDMSIKEIAKSFNCSENTVKSRLNYAKKNLSIEAEKLENKGVKLRVIAALPFLYAFFNSEKEAFAAGITNTIPPFSMPDRGVNSSVNKVVKNVSVGKKIAIISGVLGTVAAVAGVAVAISLGNGNDKKKSKNKTEYTSEMESENISTDEIMSVENIDNPDEVKWEYDDKYKGSVKLNMVKKLTPGDFPELPGEGTNEIVSFDETDSILNVHVSNDGNYIYYLYNYVKDKMIETGVEYKLGSNAEYFTPETNLEKKYDYIAVDEDTGIFNTSKLINADGDVLIPAKYQDYIMLSKQYVAAIRWEEGGTTTGTVTRWEAVYRTTYEQTRFYDCYHDVIDIYNLKTGEIIEGLSGIDSNTYSYKFEIYEKNDDESIIVYLDDVNGDTKTVACGFDGNIVNPEDLLKEVYEGKIQIKTDDMIGNKYLEDTQGNMISEYYCDIKESGEYFIIEDKYDYDRFEVEKRGYGIIDKDGNMIVDSILDKEPVKYGKDLWCISYNGQIGFMTDEGKIVGDFYSVDGECEDNNGYQCYSEGEKGMLVTPNGIMEYSGILSPYLFYNVSNNTDRKKTYTLYDYMGNEVTSMECEYVLGNDKYIIEDGITYSNVYELDIK